jgi:hypothetical protein
VLCLYVSIIDLFFYPLGAHMILGGRKGHVASMQWKV